MEAEDGPSAFGGVGHERVFIPHQQLASWVTTGRRISEESSPSVGRQRQEGERSKRNPAPIGGDEDKTRAKKKVWGNKP